MHLAVLFLITGVSCLRHHRHTHQDEQPVTVTPSGEIRGGYNITRKGRTFESYRGIRYAEPPVEDLRFQPPKLILEYKTPVDASRDGPACPMAASRGYYLDEDCLTINVYTPLKSDRKEPLPVVMFIHPGAFYSMTGRSDLAGPHYLLDRDLVLVTINYRLGTLGFLSTGDELAPGNNGFKDQVAALKWVQRNIAAFGGDPHSVTLTGYSAGSRSVMLHLLSPMSKGLFHRAISMSGSPFKVTPTRDNLYHLAVRQAELLNCPTANSTVIVHCLKTKHWRDLAYSLRGFFEFGYDPIKLWDLVIEKDFGQERFLSEDPMVALKKGKIHAVPFIVSQTRDEFFWKAFTILRNQTLMDTMNSEWNEVAPISFMLPRQEQDSRVGYGARSASEEQDSRAGYGEHELVQGPARALRKAYLHDKPLKNDKESEENLGLLYQDSIVSYLVHRMVNLMCRRSPEPVWYYEFAYIGNHSFYEDPVTKKPVGVAHQDDLIYLFSLNKRFPEVGTAGRDAITVDRMTAIWYNFAKYGDPNGGKLPELKHLDWPRMLPDNRQYLRIDNELTVHRNLNEGRMMIWEQLFPIEY